MYVSATTLDVNKLTRDFCLEEYEGFFQGSESNKTLASSAFEIRLFYMRPDFIDRSQCFLEV